MCGVGACVCGVCICVRTCAYVPVIVPVKLRKCMPTDELCQLHGS